MFRPDENVVVVEIVWHSLFLARQWRLQQLGFWQAATALVWLQERVSYGGNTYNVMVCAGTVSLTTPPDQFNGDSAWITFADVN